MSIDKSILEYLGMDVDHVKFDSCSGQGNRLDPCLSEVIVRENYQIPGDFSWDGGIIR